MQYSCWALTVWLLLTIVATLTLANDACLTNEQYKDVSKKDFLALKGTMQEELGKMKEQQAHLESIIRSMADTLSSLTKKISPHCTDSWRGTESPNMGRTGPTELPIMYAIEITEDSTLYEAFYEAARTGDIGYVTAVLARGNSSSSSINRYSLLAWHNEDNFDLTALHVAAAWGHDQVVLALLEAGASPDVKDRNGDTALHWAARRGHTETLRTLLQPKYRAHVNIQNDSGFTPIFWAAIEGHTASLEVLLAHGADHTLDNNQESPLMYASLYGHLDMVQALINNGANVAHKGGLGGFTALHYSAGGMAEGSNRKAKDIARLLLQNGADKRQTNVHGNTPSDWARERGNNKLARFIDNWQ